MPDAETPADRPATPRKPMTITGTLKAPVVNKPPGPVEAARDHLQAGRFGEASKVLEDHLRGQPGDAAAWSQLGLTCRAANKNLDAVNAFDRCLEVQPAHANAWSNRGNALKALARLDEALASYDRAIEIRPDHAEAHWNRSLVLLLSGDHAQGWPAYEWRRKGAKEAKGKQRTFPQPLWQGQDDLKGRAILLHAEQGLGDTLQFCRYALLAAQRGANVVLEVQRPLVKLLRPLFQGLPGKHQVIAQGAKLPAFDVHSPLMSMPLAMGTTLETVPADVPYLKPDPQRVARWRDRLVQGDAMVAVPAGGKVLRIGINWQGSPKGDIDRGRSMPLKLLAPLTAVPGVRLISLQKQHGLEQLKDLPPGMLVEDLGDDLDRDGAFLDSAAIISLLDVVVTTDTAMAHLAGALGARTWVLLQHVPDWRWMMHRSDSPWYPTMRLFRQPARGDWQAVVGEVVQALTAWTSSDLQPGILRNHGGEVQASANHGGGQQVLGDQGGRRRVEVFMDADGFNELRPCAGGPMLYNRHDAYIGASLRRYGEFSRGERLLFHRLLQPGHWVVEVGSNIGAHTIDLSRAVGPAGRVDAFEPQRLMFQTLCANLALNQCANVHAHPMALGAQEGTIRVPSLDPRARNNFGGLGLQSGLPGGEPVPLRTLDSLALPRCHLLKADVEGMEVDVLQGAVETIRRHRPLLYLENDREARSADLIDLVLSLGYRLYWHLPPMFDPSNHAGETENIFGVIVSINMLGVPNERPLQVNGLRPVLSRDDTWKPRRTADAGQAAGR